MIEQKHTAEDSEAPSEEGVEFSIKRKEDDIEMASKKHRIALAAGVCGIVVLAAVVAVVAGLVGKSFSGSSSKAVDSQSETFDFDEVGPDFSNIRGTTTSPSPQPFTSPTGSPISPTESPIAPTESPISPTGSPISPTGSPISPTDAPKTPTENPRRPPTDRPSTFPTAGPSEAPVPSPSAAPTPQASESPSDSPSIAPLPTANPTRMPNTAAPVTPIDKTSSTLLTFCVIADVPYFDNEKIALPGQIQDQMEDCEFLVHLGDIMKGDVSCDEEHYSLISGMMRESKVPAFIVPGDNEWNDCGNSKEIAAAWGLWTDHFMHFENNWNHTLGVVRHIDYEENFYFIKKRTLIFGLNIVGGRVHDTEEWLLRLTSEVEWIRSIVRMNVPANADGIIIMAHSKPTNDHRHFFNPLKDFIRDELENEIPVMYLHGDGHDFIHTPFFFDQANFLRIQHEGGVREPILKILADPQKLGPQVFDAFQYDRQLELQS